MITVTKNLFSVGAYSNLGGGGKNYILEVGLSVHLVDQVAEIYQ